MGLLIFLFLTLCDVIYFVRCIQLKQYAWKWKQWSRIGTFVLFMLLVVVKVLDWGFRYYLLAFILLIRAIYGIIRMIRNQSPKKVYKTSRLIRGFLFVSFANFFLAVPAMIFPQYKEIKVTGDYQVATSVATYTDQDRVDPYGKDGEKRFVNVEFWYPVDAKTDCPLILFSHGSFGIRYSNESAFRNLASHGYVVCSIDHPYHSFYTKSTDGTTTFMNKEFFQYAMNVNKGMYDAKTQIQTDRDITMIRVEDMKFVLETIREMAHQSIESPVYSIVDCNKVGAFGHSLGGAAAVELGRECNEVSAVINLDGDLLCEYLEMKENHLIINKEVYPKPLLNIWSELMINLIEKDIDNDLYPMEYIAQTAPMEYDMWYPGTSHFNFTDLANTSPFLCKLIINIAGYKNIDAVDARDTLIDMNETILHFFDAYIKDEGAFQPHNVYNIN